MTQLSPTPFWFLRHGETDWNARNLSQGRIDIPLNEAGLAQAKIAADLLKGRGIHTIVSSDLTRAKVTAEIAAEALGLPVMFDPELREVSFGEQEGQPMGDWYDSWIAGEFTPAGAEPFAELKERVITALNRATALPPPVLVVAHGALFRAVRAAMGLEINIRTPNALPLFCQPGSGHSPRPWTLTPASELAATAD